MKASEKAFENRVLAYYRKQGAIAEHLGGPEGWPDVLVIWDVGTCLMIELKSCKRKNMADIDAVALMEKSQIAFYLKHQEHVFNIYIEAKDGVFISEFYGKNAINGLKRFWANPDF